MHRSPMAGPHSSPTECDLTRTYHHLGLRLSVAGGTRVGQRYAANFDVLHVDPALPFVAVADGMGDGRGSTAAGATTMATLVEAVRTAAPEVGAATLRAAVARAQSRVRAAGAELGELTGCTLTALVTVPTQDTAWPTPPQVPEPQLPAPHARTGSDQVSDRPGPVPVESDERTGPAEVSAWIAQIGDSRAYRVRSGLLELLTVDHTAAWLGAVYGWYPFDSPAAATARYQLTRYVGHPDLPDPDLINVTLRPGDVYCVCSDGVAEQLDYRRLGDRLGAGGPVLDIVRGVLSDTLAAGGRDNATLAVLRVDAR